MNLFVYGLYNDTLAGHAIEHRIVELSVNDELEGM
jgi:hypothetical protein